MRAGARWKSGRKRQVATAEPRRADLGHGLGAEPRPDLPPTT